MTPTKAALLGGISGVTSSWAVLALVVYGNQYRADRRAAKARARAAHPAGSKLRVVGA